VKAAFRPMLLGALLALLGVVAVEALVSLGLRLLTPVGGPGIGSIVGTALGGAGGMLGGLLVVALYGLANLAAPARFPEFFGHPGVWMTWVFALLLLNGLVLALHTRAERLRAGVLRASAHEAELKARSESEARLRETEQWLRVITDNVPAIVGYVDAEERYRFNNRVYHDWLGMPREFAGRTLREIWGPELYPTLQPNVARALIGETVDFNYRVLAKGVERQIRAHYVPDVAPDGAVKGFFVLATDITSLELAQRELLLAKQRLELALEGSGTALWDTDLRTRAVTLSGAWPEMLHGPRQETRTSVEELMRLAHPEDLERVVRASVQAMKGATEEYAVEHRVRCLDGAWIWILSRGKVTERDPATGRALRMIGINFDITERKLAEQRHQELAQYDALTGAANRSLFMDRLAQAIARARRGGSLAAVFYLDLDRFKEVNDRFGHAAGDALLRRFARLLRGCVRETDTVARLGGDEFALLLEDVKGRDNACRLADKILAAARAPAPGEEPGVASSASIGIAFDDGVAAAEQLVQRADGAMYEAKGAGRNCYRLAG